MRKSRLAAFIALFLAIFASINYYVGLRSWQWLHLVAPRVAGWSFWAPFILLVSAFPLSRFAARGFSRPVADLLTAVGAAWLGLFQYLLLVALITDVVRLINRWFGVVTGPAAMEIARIYGGAVLALLVLTLLYGFWRARHPVVTRYAVTVPKSGGKHKELHVVLVSDTHFGVVNGTPSVRHMVDMVNELKPDLVLLAGDLIDDTPGPFVARNMPADLRRLKAPLGVYSILGNHDDPGGSLQAFRALMERSGIRLLVDEWVKVDDSFYVIGRDDISRQRHVGRPRTALPQLMQGVNTALPLILMDHQPYRLEEAQNAGIDLQVSGHTHRGQVYPYHFITRRTFELDWGCVRKGATHVVVSLGFGTWGPPMRLGNRPEVVSIQVGFDQ